MWQQPGTAMICHLLSLQLASDIPLNNLTWFHSKTTNDKNQMDCNIQRKDIENSNEWNNGTTCFIFPSLRWIWSEIYTELSNVWIFPESVFNYGVRKKDGPDGEQYSYLKRLEESEQQSLLTTNASFSVWVIKNAGFLWPGFLQRLHQYLSITGFSTRWLWPLLFLDVPSHGGFDF